MAEVTSVEPAEDLVDKVLDPPEEFEDPTEQPSIVEQLRKEAEELAEATWVYIPIPGFEKTGLRARYDLPTSGRVIDDIVRKVTREFDKNYDRNLFIAIDVMITLCSGFYVADPNGSDEPIMLDPNTPGEPVRYEEELADILGFKDVTSARAVVKKVFGNNDLAIGAHMEKLQRWLQNTKADINADFWQNLGG